MYSQFKYQTYHIFFGWWVYVRGVFGTGGYCPAGICPGVYVRGYLSGGYLSGGVFVLEPNTTLYSDGTTHSKQHRSKGVQPNGPPAQTITVALDMSTTFDTLNINTLIRNLLQTNIPGTIIKSIAYYIKGCKTYTTYRNHTSSQRQFKTGVPQRSVHSPTLFKICTADIPPPRAQVQVLTYADDITITSTRKHECSKEIHTTIPTYSFCLDKPKQSHTKSGQNNLQLCSLQTLQNLRAIWA